MTRSEENGHRNRSNGRPSRHGSSRGIGRVAETATRQLGELTGRRAEFVSGIERTDDGWRLTVELVEVERIPDSTSVMASYDVQTDGEGNLTGYARCRRYVRSQSDGWEA